MLLHLQEARGCGLESATSIRVPTGETRTCKFYRPPEVRQTLP